MRRLENKIHKRIKRFQSFINNYKHFIILLYAGFILFSPYKRLFNFGNFNSVFYYLLIPSLIIIILFGENISRYGFGFGDWKKALLFTAVLSISSICIVFLSVSYIPEVHSYYGNRSLNFDTIINIILLMTGWEFLFRGFMLFGLKDKFGGLYANIIQTLFFFAAHIGKPSAELYSTLFTGLIFGYICLKSRSYFPMVVIHSAIFISAVVFASL